MRSTAARAFASTALSAVFALAAPAQRGAGAKGDGAPDPLELSLCAQDKMRACQTFYSEIFADATPSEVFWLALARAEVPGGFAMIPGRSWEGPYKIKPAGFKLGEVLEAVVAAEPGYRIAIAGGVVNMLPAEEHPTLGVVLAEFKAENMTVHEMMDALKQSPEFSRALKSLGVREPPLPGEYPEEDDVHGFAFFGPVGKPVLSEKRYAIHSRGKTVREVLNEIVRGDGCAVWLYREWQQPGRGKRFYELRLLNYCTGNDY